MSFFRIYFLICIHVQVETGHRMEGIRSLYSGGREVGDFYQQDKNVVYLYFFSYAGIAAHYLYGDGVLAKYEKVYVVRTAKSA